MWGRGKNDKISCEIICSLLHSGLLLFIKKFTEMARQADADVNKPGIVTQRWQEGLEFYWEGYYSKAIPKFEEVHQN
ncbi:hypothetical protein [Aneurinibacillus terranovensis]|uniref:hypothetical protein n=1 Tax=Aneurinibacillus terranovensis TaxID=278991 RepID=UPI00041AE965|nr:hypothetical protein [Aneurinibacillus terranovensis]